VHGAVPAHFELNRGGVIPTGAPAEMVVGLIDLEMQQAGLEGGNLVALVYPATRPMFQDIAN